MPMRRTRSLRCACAASGQASTAPPSSDMKSLRLIRSLSSAYRIRRVGKGALSGFARGQNRARAVPTRRRYGKRFCPPYDVSFDHLVGAGEHGRRHVEAERLGGLEVEHQLVLGRRLHRKVGWLLALEDAIDIAGRAAVLVGKIRPIGDQAAAGGVESSVVDRGQ